MPTARAQTAQRHQVDRLAREPQSATRPADRERDVEYDDDDAPPVAEEEQHHQAGQDGAQDALRSPGCEPRW